MDYLSRALAGTHLRGSLIATLDLGAPWSLDFESSTGVPVHYAIEGEGWLHLNDGPPRLLKAGELVMFPRWTRHFLTSEPALSEPMTIRELVRRNERPLWSQGEVLDEPLPLVLAGPGRRMRLLSMVVELDSWDTNLVLKGLPDVIHLDSGDIALGPWINPIIDFLRNEERERTAGYAMVQSRLAELLFMQVVRSQLVLRPSEVASSVRLLIDPAIGRLVFALQDRPSHDWTVAEMARMAGLSRSTFAQRFLDRTGETPFEYLRAIRLDSAAERLKRGERAKAVVEEAGYRTPYSFAKAFIRRFGTTPGRYRTAALRDALSN